MATRKEPIDIEYDEPQQEAVSDAVESNDPYESQDPADWVPSMTVRIYPISKPRTKLLATANVNIAMTNALLGAGNYVGALDELYLFLTNLTAIEYIRNLMKRDRKKDSLLVLASQNIEVRPDRVLCKAA